MSRQATVGVQFHPCRVAAADPIRQICVPEAGGCGAWPGEPCRVSRPAPALDLEAIRARTELAAKCPPSVLEAARAESLGVWGGLGSPRNVASALLDAHASALDVPALLAEIARLQRALDEASRGPR